MPTLSIIIPVLNEAAVLPDLLGDLQRCRQELDLAMECLVIDGGSVDATVELCREFDVRVINGPCGRGQQLSLGGKEAGGEILMFLHADCRITSAHCLAAVETMQQNGIVAGGFNLHFDDTHPVLKLAEKLNKLRFRLTRIFYGDHGLFLRREVYAAAGGFSAQPLFEDVELSRRLKKIGRIVLTNPPIATSSRRFRQGGVIRTYLKMAVLHILHWLHVSPEFLAKVYHVRSGKPAEDSENLIVERA
ncbi:TIGR04283 family arsenosugar biosynthesis glycosyltransferase [candidate division KSB1 bacterium]|nr:TIGR04283 family arsenosugar biosynthesis glycosyltransferase [candidate division KSB1 bacterium]